MWVSADQNESYNALSCMPLADRFVCVATPVNESMVQQEYGVVGWTLHWGHGAVHEDVQGIMHGALVWHRKACLWIGKTCRMEEKRKRLSHLTR